jgi:hypothetical protein
MFRNQKYIIGLSLFQEIEARNNAILATAKMLISADLDLSDAQAFYNVMFPFFQLCINNTFVIALLFQYMGLER